VPAASERDRVRDGCWRWLLSSSDLFTEFASTASGARLRAFGELASIVETCVRRGVRDEPVLRLRERVRAALRTFDWESQAIRDPRFVVPLLALIRAADTAGPNVPELRAIVERRLAAVNPAAFETVPYRRLELRHLLERNGFLRCDRVELRRLAGEALGVLDRVASSFSVEDGYALAHTVFYLCDGARICSPRAPCAADGDSTAERRSTPIRPRGV
jgi:hypothetical protein